MGQLTFFVGSYTEYPIPGFGGIGKGIYTVRLNTDTGELTTLHTKMARNPSYLALRNDNRFLYCPTELDTNAQPKVQAYKVKSDLSLEFSNEQSISGGYPCHLSFHENNILLACYATGNVIQYPLDASGSLLPSVKEYRHQGASINEARQEGPHAHQVIIHPNKMDIYVCDLGIDTIKAYRLQEDQLVPNAHKDIAVSKGGGPRHMVFNTKGSLGYVLNELSGKVSVVQEQEGVFQEVATYNSLPDNYTEQPSASAIRLHPGGKYLYTANRSAELLTIFQVLENGLVCVGYQHTRGEEIREFNITPDGRWLIAAHQNSHDMVVYRILRDGKLDEVYRTKEILSPVCITFLN